MSGFAIITPTRGRIDVHATARKDALHEQDVGISVRELQQNLKRVIARVERGETIEVTRHRRPVARLAPVKSAGMAAPWPDLRARRRAIFGDRIVTPGAADAVIEGRCGR